MYQNILEQMDIGSLWEQTTETLRQTITEICDETESSFCQRYRYFWGDTVSLSKELLDADSIGQSQNINILISTNCESLSFDDLILVISKFASTLEPETNEALVKQLMKEIEQEVQLGGSSELAECLNQRFLFSICRYIDLNSFPFSENLKRYLLVNPNVVAELSSKFPLFYFTEHDFEEIIPHLSPLHFTRLFLAALENMKNEYIPLPILKGLLSQSYEFLAEFVPDFDKYVLFWKPLLAFYQTTAVNVNPQWELQLPNYSNNLLHLRLTGKSSVVDYTYSPAIFTFPITVIENLLADIAFKDTWLRWDDQSFFHRTLRNLRCFIFNLRNSSASKLNYPLILIRTIIFFLKNGFYYGQLNDDITSIITCLFFDAVKF
uniref:Uncharacterized protein n=1 Tax=Panagrolaimus sp. PS1159 TaxID=55785 RepID=A0AC35ETP4_9BILA